MPWNLEQNEIRQFARNPLSAVVSQLRFHTILKIGNGQQIDQFQDSIRERFPEYSEDEHRVFRLRSDGIESRQERRFHFSTADETTTVTLGASTLAVESRAHETHKQFVKDFSLAAAALNDIYGPVSSTRLGLRYINNLTRSRISTDLQREVSWSDLVAGEFLHLPSSIDGFEDTFFSNEITSTIGDGKLTLRYGLLPGNEEHENHYKFDLDRYRENDVSLGDIEILLTQYAKDIYNLFLALPGPALQEWLGQHK